MFSVIVSASNPRIKKVIQLRESRIRRREEAFLVDGYRESFRAWNSGFEFVEVFWNAGRQVSADERVSLESSLEKTCSNPERRKELASFLRLVDRSGVPTIPLSENIFEKIGFGERDECVVAVVKSRLTSFSSLEKILEKKVLESKETPLLAVIEGVEKPGNIGAILRSADGAGLDALLIAADSYDVFNPNAVRSSLGAIFHLPIVVAPTEELLGWLRAQKIQRATALCDESIPYVNLDYRLPTAIVLGSEANGLSPVWAVSTPEDEQNRLLQKIRLPMLGIADSLNVSNAAAILFYEARRVRSYSS